MTENSCIEQDVLVDYLYGEADADTRLRVEAHARGCAQCADEIGGLREVRDTLETWSPPPAALGFRAVSDTGEHKASVAPLTSRFGWTRLRRVPAWGLAAAVAMVLATAATIAKPEVQFTQGGMVVRIGWTDTMTTPAPVGADSSPEPELLVSADEPRRDQQPVRGTPVGTGGGASDRDPRLGDPARGGAPAVSGTDGVTQGVRQVIRESEQRQQRALLTGLQQLEQQQANRRRADLVDMERLLAQLGEADAELVQELLEYTRQLLSR
jgi:hypothetical protein